MFPDVGPYPFYTILRCLISFYLAWFDASKFLRLLETSLSFEVWSTDLRYPEKKRTNWPPRGFLALFQQILVHRARAKRVIFDNQLGVCSLFYSFSSTSL